MNLKKKIGMINKHINIKDVSGDNDISPQDFLKINITINKPNSYLSIY